MATGSLTIYTIGHGNGTFAELAERLDAQQIRMLVDVRSIPYSSHAPDFSRNELMSFAAGVGVGYRWLGDRLGGKPTKPELTTASGDADYDAIARTAGFSAALDEVEGLAANGPLALLCAELDPARCHRSRLIAPGLEARGHHVRHILSTGVTPHQRDLGF